MAWLVLQRVHGWSRNVVLISAALALGFGTLGCGKGGTSTATVVATNKAAVDPWPRAVAAFRKESDAAAGRRILAELNSALAASQDAEQPVGLVPEIEAILKDDLRLLPPDLGELRSSTYTPLDGAYTAECFYLRDVVRSLDIAPLPTARKAQAAFDWVMRHVLLQPWIEPMNPSLTLTRGAGRGLDRAYVFIALCRQMGLDAYLIGQAGAYDWKANHVPAGFKEAKGPFWAVGVRDDKDILLFEPWRGVAFPGSGTRPGTLAELRARPELLKPWIEDKIAPWDVSVNQVNEGLVYCSLPLSCFAPRLKLLETKLAGDSGVDLFVDWAVFKAAATTAAGNVPVKFWNPPDDTFSLPRVLQAYLPTQDGGYGLTAGLPIAERCLIDSIPRSELTIKLDGLNPEMSNQLNAIAITTYRNLFQLPPTPRERIQRGQHGEITASLMRAREEFTSRLDRLRTVANPDEVLAKFIGAANSFADSQAENRRKGATPAELDQALGNFLKTQAQGVLVSMDPSLARVNLAEITYLLALSTHDKAERAQLSVDRSQAALDKAPEPARHQAVENLSTARKAAFEAWSVARDWWTQYEAYAEWQDKYHPGRKAQHERLSARARWGTDANR